jgi:hypothetical protein
MKKRTNLVIRVLMLLLATLCVIQLDAQMNMSKGKAPQTGPYRSIDASLKMRPMNNAKHRAAAARNRKRKAAAGQKNQVIHRGQKGGR